MQWNSPWGRGYPGWHIECSAMSMKYLGETLDIHTGGTDHIPVHHENEIAQSESATGQPFVRYFVHNAFLVERAGTKISKSSGKFPVLGDIIGAGMSPMAFRLLCFGAKYRSELVLSDGIQSAQKNYDYIAEFVRGVPDDLAKAPEDSAWAGEYRERFSEAINNDLNTSQALAVVLDLIGEAYRRSDHRIWNTFVRSIRWSASMWTGFAGLGRPRAGRNFRRRLRNSSRIERRRGATRISRAPMSFARNWRSAVTTFATRARAPATSRAPLDQVSPYCLLNQ